RRLDGRRPGGGGGRAAAVFRGGVLRGLVLNRHGRGLTPAVSETVWSSVTIRAATATTCARRRRNGAWERTLVGMPRPPRLAPPGGIFHITSRGNRRQVIFFDDDDRRWFIRLLDRAVGRFRWKCHAYCLMDNHLHLLVETPDENLSQGMQWLLGRYAQDFNWRHGFDGHLFQGRFKSQRVQSNWHLIELGRYIVLNPVRARMRAAA